MKRTKVKISPDFKLLWNNKSSLTVALTVCYYLFIKEKLNIEHKSCFDDDLNFCIQDVNYQYDNTELQQYIKKLQVNDLAYDDLKENVFKLGTVYNFKTQDQNVNLKFFITLWNKFCSSKIFSEHILTKTLCSYLANTDDQSVLLYDNLNPLAEDFFQKTDCKVSVYNSDFYNYCTFFNDNYSLNLIRTILGFKSNTESLLINKRFSAAFSFTPITGTIDFISAKTRELYETLKRSVTDRFAILTAFPVTSTNVCDCNLLRQEFISDHFLKAVIKLPKMFFPNNREHFVFLVFDKKNNSDHFSVIDLSKKFIDHNFSKKRAVVLSANVNEIISKLLNDELPASSEELNDCYRSVSFDSVNKYSDFKIDPTSFLINLPLTDSVPLESIADVIYGIHFSSKKINADPDIEHNTFLELNLIDVPKTGIITKVPKKIYVKKDYVFNKEKILRNGDIVFSIKGTIGKVGYLNDDRENVIPGQCYLIVRTKNEKAYPQKLIFSQLRCAQLQKLIKSKIIGKTLNVLQPGELKRLPLIANADKYKAQAEKIFDELLKINGRQKQLNEELQVLDHFKY